MRELATKLIIYETTPYTVIIVPVGVISCEKRFSYAIMIGATNRK